MEQKESKTSKTYNTKDSPVVTDLSTDLAISSLIKGERTGSHVAYYLWSYVTGTGRGNGLSTLPDDIQIRDVKKPSCSCHPGSSKAVS